MPVSGHQNQKIIMKRVVLSLTLLAFYQMDYGQCNQKVLIKCTSVRHLKDGAVVKEGKMEAAVSIGDGTILLTATDNGQTQTKELEIKEIVCEWKAYMKNGRAQYKVSEKGSDGNPHNSIVDVVSDNGYTSITFASDPDSGSKLQFDVAEYSIATDAIINNSPVQPVKKSKKKRASKAPVN
jgi:hypothetical protein